MNIQRFVITKHGNKDGITEEADKLSAELMAIFDSSGRKKSSAKEKINIIVGKILDIVITSCDNLYA